MEAEDSVVRSAIGDIPVCLGGEVDCVQGTTPLRREYPILMVAEPGTSHPGLEKCVELKTNKVIRNGGQETAFHKYVAMVIDALLIPLR